MSLKPIAKARKLPVLQEVLGTSLWRNADELLLTGAEVISEGMVETGDNGQPTYCGTTFISVDLDRTDLGIEAAAYPALADASRRSIYLHSRLMRLVRREVENRSAPRLPTCMSVEMKFKIEDPKLLVDINIECPLAEPARGEDSVEEDEG